jgi:hypothetical protein
MWNMKNRYLSMSSKTWKMFRIKIYRMCLHKRVARRKVRVSRIEKRLHHKLEQHRKLPK